MDDDDRTTRARSFEHGAREYERLRPEFPARLFDDVRASAGTRVHGRVLEVGAGTGRATVPLALRGAAIEVVEPSAEMLAVLVGRLDAEVPGHRCDLRQATFEDVDPAGTYDMVVAAQSFHWTDPATRWSRLSSLLRAGGAAYLFWNGWHLAPQAHDLHAVTALYAGQGHGLLPDVAHPRSGTAWATGTDWAESEIAAEPALALVDARSYAWPWRLPLDEYLGLLRTTSQYAVAPSGVREPLLASLGELLGDVVTLCGATRLLRVEAGTGTGP